jgi:hypothetical protein
MFFLFLFFNTTQNCLILPMDDLSFWLHHKIGTQIILNILFQNSKSNLTTH